MAESWTSRIAEAFDHVKKVVIGVAAALASVVVIVAIVRAVFVGGIVIDPVVVKASDPALTPELAAQQIARQLSRVQRAGVEEWRRVHVDDGTTQSVDLQIPGSPLGLQALAREVVALFGLAPRTLRVAISRGSPAGYIAVVSLVGDHASMVTCQETKDGPDVLDRIYECIALKAIAIVDPKVAASYVFQREREACEGLNTGVGSYTSALEREELRIRNRRDNCSFGETQRLIAQVLSKGRKVDLPWVPYIYGQVHLARAAALSGIGLQQRLSEFDQAIGRFQDALHLLPKSQSTIAVLMEAYLAKGIATHESTVGLKWDDPELQFRLAIAERTLAEAQKRLGEIPLSRSAALEALVGRQEALLRYRLWMIKAHRRTRSSDVTIFDGKKEEADLLEAANRAFASAEDGATLSSLDYMHWGNILRARGDFQGAVAKYRQAADLAPADSGPALNIAIAYLDRVVFAPGVAPPDHVLVALGALSDYLAWMTGGGPYNLIIPKTKLALARTGVGEDLEAFSTCIDKRFAAEPGSDSPLEKWRAAATYKICVDEAIDRVAARLRDTKKT